MSKSDITELEKMRTKCWIYYLTQITGSETSNELWNNLGTRSGVGDEKSIKNWFTGKQKPSPMTLENVNGVVPGSADWYLFGPFKLPFWNALTASSNKDLAAVKDNLNNRYEFFNSLIKKPRELLTWVEFIDLIIEYKESTQQHKLYRYSNSDEIKNRIKEHLSEGVIALSMHVYNIDRTTLATLILNLENKSTDFE